MIIEKKVAVSSFDDYREKVAKYNGGGPKDKKFGPSAPRGPFFVFRQYLSRCAKHHPKA